MAKNKKKTIIIDENELSQTTLGQLNSRKSSIVPLLVVFGIFMLCVYFLPTITNYLETLKNNGLSGISPNKPNPSTPTPDDTVVEIKKETYTDNMSLTAEKFSVKQLLIKDDTLVFTVENTSDNYLNLSNYNYFLEFYNEDTLVNRRIIEKTTLKKGISKSYSYNLNLGIITSVSLREISKEEYPSVDVLVDDNNHSQIICVNDNESITYFAENNKIYNIEHVIKSNTSNPNYVSLFTKMQTLTGTLTNITGINATFELVGTDSFKASIYIDLTSADLSRIEEKSYYYENKTTLDVIKFEIESQGFTCS